MQSQSKSMREYLTKTRKEQWKVGQIGPSVSLCAYQAVKKKETYESESLQSAAQVHSIQCMKSGIKI